jgi:large subunit ribosomal protein L31
LPAPVSPVYIAALAHQTTATIEDRAVKPGIHPKYQRANVVCACGNQFVTQSTSPEIHIEICGRCHPFFTGKQKLIDTAGRVERFRKKYGGEKAAG